MIITKVRARFCLGERPFKCEDCGQTFALNSSLYTHKKLHSNELPHECDGCHKRFRNSGNLKTHRERKLCGVTDNDLFKNNVAADDLFRTNVEN